VIVEAGVAAKAILATLGMMALQGTIVALLALAVVRVGRMRPAWQAAVWLVVLAKFALPWGPAMPWSLSDLFALVTQGGGGAPIVVAPTSSTAATATASIVPALGWLALGTGWAVGLAIVLARGIGRYRGALHAARVAPDAPAGAQALLCELAARVQTAKPRLVVGDPSVGPYVVGALRAIIVVPPVLLDDPVLLRAALMHELAHVKRRDAFGRVIQLVAVAMFWWLPVVRIASNRLELARERACDAWALETGDVSRPAYARLLLKMAQLRVAAAPALAAPHALDARITSVLGPVVRPRLGIAHRLALALWALIVLGGARSASATSPQETCIYTPQIAEALRQAYPEADADQDGFLSRDEACDFQAERRTTSGEPQMLAEPLYCRASEGLTSPLTTSAEASCTEEGVSR
jgi:beta-lactamase regulating signal transducer with metallopeptidase domain